MQKVRFNLGYRMGWDLFEIPEDLSSMTAYTQFLQNEIKLIPEPVPESKIRPLIKFLGELGTYSKMIKHPQVALESLEKSLDLINHHHIGIEVWGVHTLRYGEVQRALKNDIAAETAIRSILEMVSRSKELRELEDFAWQSLGKLRFDQKNTKEAEECFNRALEIRKRKGIKELIEATEFALNVIKAKAMKPVSLVNKYKKS